MTRTLPPENLRDASLDFPPAELAHLGDFVAIAGAALWQARMRDLQNRIARSNREGALLRQRHGVELALDRLLHRAAPGTGASLSPIEIRLAGLAADGVALSQQLSPAGAARLGERMRASLTGEGTLIELFHLLRTAALHRSRGFEVVFTGLEEEAPHDLLLRHEDGEAECACVTLSAERGRDIHRAAWARFCDETEAQLKAWLEQRPGRYLLKITLTRGLSDAEPARLAQLGERVRAMLTSGSRIDQDAEAALRLEPLALASRASEEGLIARLRQEFGPEAHIAVCGSPAGIWAMAARAGRRTDVAGSVRHALDALTPQRLSGQRPGILALFLEDLDRQEWQDLRDSLELEGAARQFLTCDKAAPVAAVTCYSRMEMFGVPGPSAVADGELRFRNPGHPAAKIAFLASAISSSP